MAFELTNIGINTFSARPGKKFTVSITTSAGQLLQPLAQYKDQKSDQNPFTFSVEPEMHRLQMSVLCTAAARLTFSEVDGANSQVLAQRDFTGNLEFCTLRIEPRTAPLKKAAKKKGGK